MPDAAADAPAPDPWLVVGRRGRARPVAAHRSVQHAVPLDAGTDADGQAPPPAPRAGPTRLPTDPAARLSAGVAAAEAAILASGWWTGLVRAMRAAVAAYEAGGSEDGGEGGGGGGSPSFAWARVGGVALLGLGSLEGATTPTPRAQAALACLLARHLASLGDCGGVSGDQRPRPLRLVCADPAFTPADTAALAATGFEALSPDAAVAALAAGITPATPWLAYLPHCPSSVMEGVLAAVGPAGHTSHLALLGNALSEVADRWACPLPNGRGGRAATDSHGCSRPGLALGLVEAGRVVEVGLAAVGGGGGGEAKRHAAAFDSTALHLFLPPPAGGGASHIDTGTN